MKKQIRNMSYNPFSLEGKTILVTGASSGIGQSTAIECSKLGAKLVITARNKERLQETFDLLEGDGHIQIIGDLTNEEDVERIISETPKLDGLVNNAGISVVKPVAFVNQPDLQKVFNTNTFAPIVFTRLLLKKKKLNSNASIVFTSSIAAMHSSLGNSMYGASKAAVTAFMHYCARELAGKQIRANAVHPGMINTKLISGGAISSEQHQLDMQKYPLKRYGEPEEVAWAIIYLLSDAAAWVTGTSLIIDGGIMLT